MIYFCIPVHNEEKTVGVVLWKLRQVMAQFPRDYQILLADDGSTDGTAKALEPYRRVLPLIHLRCNRSRGYAASLEMLLREASRRSRYPRRDVVVIMQADFSDDAEDVPALLRKMESGADVAVGGPISVAGRAGLAERMSALISRRLLQRHEWPEPVADPLHGFSAIRLSCVRRALGGKDGERLLKWEGMAANAALFAAVAPLARRIEAVEMTKHPERRQRPRRARLISSLAEVYRFVRGRPSPGLAAPDRLVPDEVHGDLSALRQESDGEKPRPRRRPPRRRGEQEEERPRKDGERRPRKSAARKRKQDAEGEKAETADRPAAETKKPRRRRGGTGSGTTKPRQKPQEAGAGSGPPDPPTPAPESGDAGDRTGDAEAGAPPKKRRRRGRRGGSGRRRKSGPDGSSGESPGPDDSEGKAPGPDGAAGPQSDGAG